jgi:hypothetical protein
MANTGEFYRHGMRSISDSTLLHAAAKKIMRRKDEIAMLSSAALAVSRCTHAHVVTHLLFTFTWKSLCDLSHKPAFAPRHKISELKLITASHCSRAVSDGCCPEEDWQSGNYERSSWEFNLREALQHTVRNGRTYLYLQRLSTLTLQMQYTVDKPQIGLSILRVQTYPSV